MTTEKQPSKYLRKIMNKSKENRKKGLASPIFNTISDMKKWYDNQDDTTEKQETMERFREIGLESAYRLDRLFYSDKTGMQVIEDFIQSAVQKARSEVAEEIVKDIIQENYPSTDIDHKRMGKILNHIQAKYLSPTQEKDQNKINTRSIDTEEK